jgi:acyl transferase domain-containing protein
MGHSEPTSGIAGIMKVVLAVEHGIIPPTIGIKTFNPNIDFKEGRLRVVQASTPWPDFPIRRASVNSFGYGGANAHAIIESVDSIIPGYRSKTQTESSVTLKQVNGLSNGTHKERRKFLLPFSAHDERTLRSNVAALADGESRWEMSDLAYTLSARRTFFSHRSYVVAESGSLGAALASTDLVVKKYTGTRPPRISFIFTGKLRAYSRAPALTLSRSRCAVAADGPLPDGGMSDVSSFDS